MISLYREGVGEGRSVGVWCECDESVDVHYEWVCVFKVCQHTHALIASVCRCVLGAYTSLGWGWWREAVPCRVKKGLGIGAFLYVDFCPHVRRPYQKLGNYLPLLSVCVASPVLPSPFPNCYSIINLTASFPRMEK